MGHGVEVGGREEERVLGERGESIERGEGVKASRSGSEWIFSRARSFLAMCFLLCFWRWDRWRLGPRKDIDARVKETRGGKSRLPVIRGAGTPDRNLGVCGANRE